MSKLINLSLLALFVFLFLWAFIATLFYKNCQAELKRKKENYSKKELMYSLEPCKNRHKSKYNNDLCNFLISQKTRK